MKKYKLIKEYPGSPKLGTIIEHCDCKNCSYPEYGLDNLMNPISAREVEDFPEFWERIKEDWRTWTTLEDVCRIANININELDIPKGQSNRDRRLRGMILFDICQLICEVFREGVEMDYSNPDQRKYYLWGKYKADSGWSLGDVLCVSTYTSVGARLSVDTWEKALHIWKYFKKYFIEYWEGK